ncbi:putative metal-dependent hydrolase [Cohnella pontilimi]|uniref:Putative metal-dependent hydrolase E5161_01910 n=1 Tax=Cohnella pontilimi TaxID=2564100 RepID=A0A4U0FGP3_9BACL|nr:bacillithiol transferase BstA [Cohnella pontilimi]TJY44173.1 putative metal-dependent hydrolase [Cohnella pontilimi]
MTEDLRYPVGKFHHEGDITAAHREAWMRDIEQLPDKLAAAIQGLSPEQLNTPYRDGGWTVRQVVHHLADSHMNAFIRMKLALTEERPTIKPYEEGDWAALPDSVSAEPQLSLDLLKGLHARWILLLQSMSDADFAKTFFHPGSQQVQRLDRTLGLYAWHSRHHVAHITSLRERMGW